MFVTVRHGADQTEIFNHQCRIVNFIDYIKQTCDCETEACIDLMDESGNLMNLSVRQNSLELASKVLKERRRYILIKVTKQDDCEAIKYESMLKNIERCHPILADQLWKLSNPKAKDRKESTPRKPRPTKEVVLTLPPKNKSAFGTKKNSSATQKAF